MLNSYIKKMTSNTLYDDITIPDEHRNLDSIYRSSKLAEIDGY